MNRNDLDVLIDEETLQHRIAELGREITNEYADKDLAVVAVLKGSYMFLADLTRAIKCECTVDFLGVSSYGHRFTSSGVVQITSDLTSPIEGRVVEVDRSGKIVMEWNNILDKTYNSIITYAEFLPEGYLTKMPVCQK